MWPVILSSKSLCFPMLFSRGFKFSWFQDYCRKEHEIKMSQKVWDRVQLVRSYCKVKFSKYISNKKHQSVFVISFDVWSLIRASAYNPLPSKSDQHQFLKTISIPNRQKRLKLTTREQLTNWLTIGDCLTLTIDGSKRTKYWLRVFIANNITA